ncbi:hypothetical protein P8452_50353 [Trifolium repens]|nr:hypothetical protein P8452_50353 [Trifolium repens]
MECYKIIGQVVLPVFYGVLLSDTRTQSGEFGKAFLSNKGGMFSKAFDCYWNSFSKDDSQDKVQRWKEALGQAAGLAGYVVQNSRYTIDRYIPNMYVYI